MWSDSMQECDVGCQCSGLITDSFTINSGNNASKRRREEASAHNYKIKMSPHTLNFNKSPLPPLSPLVTPKRRVFGEIQNSPITKNGQLKTYSKISKIIEERKVFKMSNKENSYEFKKYEETTFIKYEDTKESSYDEASVNVANPICNKLQKSKTVKNWTLAKLTSDCPDTMQSPSKFEDSSGGSGFLSSVPTLSSPLSMMDEQTIDFSEIIQSTSFTSKQEPTTSFTMTCEPTTSKKDLFVPTEENIDLDQDFEALHDLEEEFTADNFDNCSKYEIISTDSPNIITRSRPTRRVTSENLIFGAPISDIEQSTSFNKPQSFTATRILDFENLDLESPVRKPSLSVKKSLKFQSDNETPGKNALTHERSDSSIGTMSNSSPMNSNRRLKLFSSESTTSMESGFMSEMEDTFLDLEEQSNSPKVANFSDLLSGQIKENILVEKSQEPQRPAFQRSFSYNPDNSKARVSLFSILESPEKRGFKRTETMNIEAPGSGKRRKNDDGMERPNRPVLKRALSENEASIMSALARSSWNPDLIGDFSLPCALPLTIGQHSDLKSISTDTLADLLKGQFVESISDFQVIDCRYPYEFKGGHIKGAKNLYTRDQVLSLMDKSAEECSPRSCPEDMVTESSRRSILVFHCEFSQERGPKLSRFLRLSDRDQNKENYPSLQYPEVYLLDKGYRAFYSKYPELCEPSGYTPMLDPKHKKDLDLFRNEEKSLKKSLSLDERRTLHRQKSRSRLLL